MAAHSEVIPMAVRPMVRSDLPQEIQEILKKPLPAEAIGVNPKIPGLSSIKAAFVIERLNEAFGTGGWDDSATIIDRVTRKDIRNAGQPNEKEVTMHIATVQLFFTVEKYGLHKENFGGSDNVDLGDALKGARTDALTKIASELGVGLDIYKSGREDKADDLPACPACKKTGSIIKGKAEYGGGWLCFGKKGGCGAKFTDAEMEQIKSGKVEQPKPAQSAQQPRQQQRQQPQANDVEKITIHGIVADRATNEGKLWLKVGERRCVTMQEELKLKLKTAWRGAEVKLMVSELSGQNEPFYQIHKVIGVKPPQQGGRQ